MISRGTGPRITNATATQSGFSKQHARGGREKGRAGRRCPTTHKSKSRQMAVRRPCGLPRCLPCQSRADGGRIRTLWARMERQGGQRRTGWRPWRRPRTSQPLSQGVRVEAAPPQPSQGQGRADRDPRNRMVLNESKSLRSRQMALCLQTQDGEKRRGRRVGIKAGGIVART